MNAGAKEYIRKLPGLKQIAGQFEVLEEKIEELSFKQSVLARENIDLRLKLKKISGDKIHVVFVCHRPAVWESLHSVYDCLKADERFQITIVAIPNKKQLPGVELNHKEYETEGAEAFWESYECIHGYDYETKKWLDLKSLSPDYIFFQQPYNITRCPEYQSRIVSQYAKIAYVSYFAPTDLDQIYDECAPLDYLRDLSFFFTQHEEDTRHIEERFQKIEYHQCKIINTGFPRYDHIDEYRGKTCQTWNNTNSFRILWTPRWTTNEDNCFFFAYRDCFTDYCQKHPEIEFVFRPHPQAFSEWKAQKQMTEEEERQYRASFKGNMHLDESKNYFPLMFSSDCLVTDKSSMFIDYFFTGKPIIYCRKNNHNSDVIPRLSEGLYMVYSWEELEKTIQELMKGNDPLKPVREEIRDHYLRPRNGKASERIKEILLEDALK